METATKLNIESIFNAQVNAFESQLSGKPLNERKKDLQKLRKWIVDNEKLVVQALYKDLKKPEHESLLAEIKTVLTEIDDSIKHLKTWNEPTRVSAPLSLFGTKSYVLKQPKGVVLIISPWNFPFQLMVIPLVSALAAGCKCILKPSEFAHETALLIENMISELFITEDCTVINGDVEVSKSLLSLPFNHIFFTGSPQVGKIVMRAASEHLTSVTLELGGCNPLIVESSANLDDTCAKIAWGKLLNAGQSCVSPNLIFVPESLAKEFTEKLVHQVDKMFGLGIKALENKNLTHIINNNHFNRLKNLIDDALEKGARNESEIFFDEKQSFIAPLILSNINKEMQLVSEEIFGPIFPIITYNNANEIKVHLKKLPTPLAFYVFGKSGSTQKWIENSRAGTTAINETTIQVSHPNLPFGGCNTSGIGKCHGYYGFREFINERSVLVQPENLYSTKMIYTPLNGLKKSLIRFLALKVR